MSENSLNVLIIEDSTADTELLIYEMRRGGFDPVYERVDTPDEMRSALETRNWDLIVADYNLPEFSAPDALELLQTMGRDIPFIIVSGVVGEETAVAAMKAGARDFIIKQNLARLVPAVQRELREAEVRRERTQAEEQVKLLQNMSLAVSESEDLLSALGVALKRICNVTGWVYGEAWVPDADCGVVQHTTAWYASAEGYEKFAHLCETYTFAPGKGLPGRVWQSKFPAWIRDIAQDTNFPRAAAAREIGLKSALAVPVLAEDEVVVILSFFLAEPTEEDEKYVQLVSAIAAQIASLIQRKRAVEALRESRNLFEAFMSNTPAIAFMKDAEGRYTYINQPMEKLFKIRLSELRGKTDLEWLPPGTARLIRESDNEVLNTGQTIELFEVIPTPDGNSRYWWVFKFPFQDAAGHRYVGAVAIDVTDRKSAE
jgi:PAS domain S-box-containing protein